MILVHTTLQSYTAVIHVHQIVHILHVSSVHYIHLLHYYTYTTVVGRYTTTYYTTIPTLPPHNHYIVIYVYTTIPHTVSYTDARKTRYIYIYIYIYICVYTTTLPTTVSYTAGDTCRRNPGSKGAACLPPRSGEGGEHIYIYIYIYIFLCLV